MGKQSYEAKNRRTNRAVRLISGAIVSLALGILTVNDFINATSDYHNGGDINKILDVLDQKEDIVPIFIYEE